MSKIKASELASAIMIIQLFCGAFVVAIAFDMGAFAVFYIFMGLALMVSAPIYVIISVRRQELAQK